MDIIIYVGNLQNKEKIDKGCRRVYFDPSQYSVAEELETQKGITEDMAVQEKVKQKSNSSPYLYIKMILKR